LPEAAAVLATSADAPVLHWLALSLTPGLGPLKARKIAEHFGSAENVFKATLTELEATSIQAVSAQSLATGRSLELAHDELGRAAQADVSILCFDAPAYPAQLKQIYDPPIVLYVRGNSQAISHPGIAVVGTRHPTPTAWEWRNAFHVTSLRVV
jgi:DNA processing protein